LVIALAGRRIDAPDAATPRFPVENTEIASRRIRELLKTQGATALVSSAACGADLLALVEAGALGIRRRVVLPFDRKRFREISVVDRPGEWGRMYDGVLDELSSTGDVVTLNGDTNGDSAYAAANHAILDEAGALARETGQPVSAVLVWEGVSRGSDDLTGAFGDTAKKRGLRVFDVRTL
jgi:hypothetical protein